jgi:hypothetical protein
MLHGKKSDNGAPSNSTWSSLIGKSGIEGKLTMEMATVMVAVATGLVALATFAPRKTNDPVLPKGKEPAPPVAAPVLAGTVLDAKDDTPIEGAALTVVTVNNRVIKAEHSDSGGGFRIFLPDLHTEEPIHLVVVKERYVKQDLRYAPPIEGVTIRLVPQ